MFEYGCKVGWGAILAGDRCHWIGVTFVIFGGLLKGGNRRVKQEKTAAAIGKSYF